MCVCMWGRVCACVYVMGAVDEDITNSASIRKLRGCHACIHVQSNMCVCVSVRVRVSVCLHVSCVCVCVLACMAACVYVWVLGMFVYTHSALAKRSGGRERSDVC